MSAQERPWHSWYAKFAPTSTEVEALKDYEPAELPEWAVLLRQQMPSIPPAGVEMCHARWLETLDRLIQDIGDGAFRRRSHWCGDLPLETVAGLGLRRRILKSWLTRVPREALAKDLKSAFGMTPDTADLLYDVLGEVREAPEAVRQDMETLADLFSGPYEAGNKPIEAKWRVRLPELEQRGSVLAKLKDGYFPVLTNLCNYRTLADVDRLIGMVARQRLDLTLLGPCNMSLKFVLQDQPERMSASIAAVWALHRFAAEQFQGDVSPIPLGVRDQSNALLKRLGHADPIRAWLSATLGFMVKKWVRRAWHLIQAEIPDNALPDFSFKAGAMKSSGQATDSSAAASDTKKQPGRAPSLPMDGSHDAPMKVPREAAPASATPAPTMSKAPSSGGSEWSMSTDKKEGEAKPNDTSSSSGKGHNTGLRRSGGISRQEILAAAAAAEATKSPDADASGSGRQLPVTAPSNDDWEKPMTIGGNTRILTPKDLELLREEEEKKSQG